MKKLILILSLFAYASAYSQESFSINYSRMGTNYGKSSGDVVLSSDSVITVYLNLKEKTFLRDTITTTKILYLGEYWYQSKSKNIYFSLYRNPKLSKLGIYIPEDNITYWYEN